jgi:hypothetical protein
MLEQEIAALVHFFKPLQLKEYFGQVPQNAATPSVYYPVPEIGGNEYTLRAYDNSFSLFLKVFDKDDLSSYSIAAKMEKMIQSAKKKIPMYDEDGKPTGHNFRIKKLSLKNIDTGTTQIEITWDVMTLYDTEPAEKVQNFYYEGLATTIEEEDSDNGED